MLNNSDHTKIRHDDHISKHGYEICLGIYYKLYALKPFVVENRIK